jgi:hypothetical protein
VSFPSIDLEGPKLDEDAIDRKTGIHLAVINVDHAGWIKGALASFAFRSL